MGCLGVEENTPFMWLWMVLKIGMHSSLLNCWQMLVGSGADINVLANDQFPVRRLDSTKKWAFQSLCG